MAAREPLPRPGRPSPTIDEMLRVDHAGEYSAVRIYDGQLAVFSRNPRHAALAKMIRHMGEQEQVHLEAFDRLLNERAVRPTVMAPVWHMAGYALGAVTALMGEKAAMACTAAVEEVIDGHYARQEERLRKDDPALAGIVAKFRADEQEHRDTAIEQGAKEAPGYGLLSAVIKTGCRLAIRISEKI